MKREAWQRKLNRLNQLGKVYYIWECHWELFVAEDPEIEKTITKFPHIMHRRQHGDDLIKAVRDGSFYGFIECDLWCSDELIEKLKWINFPPIIAKRNVDGEILSPYMAERYAQENKTLDQQALIQTYRGKNLFVLSELLAFYLDLGYEVRNIQMATQYLGEHCFVPFINKAVDMRIKATDAGDETKSNTAKIMCNSSYGKLLENPYRHTETKIVTDEKLKDYIRNPLISNHQSLETQSGEFGLNEVVMQKKIIDDKFPMHVGNAVLQHSKLHFLRFVYFLWEHVTPGSMRLVYCDTDSIGKHLTIV